LAALRQTLNREEKELYDKHVGNKATPGSDDAASDGSDVVALSAGEDDAESDAKGGKKFKFSSIEEHV